MEKINKIHFLIFLVLNVPSNSVTLFAYLLEKENKKVCFFIAVYLCIVKAIIHEEVDLLFII